MRAIAWLVAIVAMASTFTDQPDKYSGAAYMMSMAAFLMADYRARGVSSEVLATGAPAVEDR